MNKPGQRAYANWRNFTALGGAAAGLSWWLGRRGGRLESNIKDGRDIWSWGRYKINFAAAGDGQPLVLIHAFYPGASSNQWELNFDHLSRRCRVFAPDLPGFGLSSRPTNAFTPELYQTLIEDFLRAVVRAPAIVAAAGQAAAVVIKIAAEKPELISGLILDTPTGLTRFSRRPSFGQWLAHSFWSLPVAGSLGWFAMTSKPFIRRQLQREVFADPELITPDLVNDLYNQTHAPGAKWAPIAMLGGYLNCDANSAYRALNQPILVVWGEMSGYIPAGDAEEFARSNPRAELHVFPDCRLMPEYEHPSKFNNLIENWTRLRRAA